MLFKKKTKSLFTAKDIDAKLAIFHKEFTRELRRQARTNKTDKGLIDMTIKSLGFYRKAQKAFFEMLSKAGAKED